MRAKHPPGRAALWARSGAVSILFLAATQVSSQPYWSRDVGGAGNEHVSDVKTDADGSVYVTGEFSGTIQFGTGSYVSSGAIDLFVAKLDPAGAVQWFVQGGGAGIDRGLKVAVGTGGAIAVAGEFMGNATVFGTPLTSAGGTADMYVAVLNKADGAVQWIRQGGGTTGTDRPGGVSMAADGRVTVAGEFRGTATWETSTLTSMMDGTTGQPSVDVFIATYSPTGDLLWLKHGAASAADGAVDVVHDPAGNIYVTGQYSHDITFGQTYPNALLNASFLLKLDAAGSDLWFRRFGGGAFNQVRDMVYASDGRLLITGDLQGTMVFSGTTNVNVAATQPFAYYLLSVGTDGVLQGHITRGSQSGVTVRGLTMSGNLISVLGAFDCRFTDFCTHYGAQGIFMASGDEDLFIARHATSNLALQEAQQFGGASVKSPGAIDAMPGGDLVFCGSFQRNLIFPAQPGFQADATGPGGGVISNGATTYCGDANYGSFAASLSAGLTDGFVARGYVNGRAPYDWWNRPGSGCDREPLQPCIQPAGAGECADTVRVCGSVLLNVLPHYSLVNSSTANFLGPPVTYLWSNGSTGSTIAVNTSGTYTVTLTSHNGCWQWTDQIVVIIDPLPPFPLIHDDVVVNTGVPDPLQIDLCDPQTQWVWATSVAPGSTFWWQPPLGADPVYNDSIMVDTAGVYSFHIVNDAGCERVVQVTVTDAPNVPMPDIGLSMQIDHPDDIDLNDSLSVCTGTPINFTYTPQWTMDGVPVDSLPEGLLVFWGLAPGDPTTEGDSGPQEGQVPANTSGWFTTEVIVLVTNAPCLEDSLFFTAIDSIYIEVYPPIAVSVSLTGPSVVCDGDTITLTAACTDCEGIEWGGPSFGMVDEWTIAVWGAGNYAVTATATDQYGCDYSAGANIQVTMPTGPVLNVAPTDGILCPGGTATVSTTTQGTDPVWYGPSGPMTGLGTTLVTDVAGTYYLTLVVGGCPVVSNSVELFSYSTPFLALEPAPVLCYPGDQAVLQIMAAPSAQVQWHAPLSGNAFTQTVSQPGTYTCSVTACGIVTPLSIEVLYAPITAELTTPGPFHLCGADSVVLQAGGNASSYLWLPGGEQGSQLVVGTAGSYQVVVGNDAGCRDTSAVVLVQEVIFNEPLVALGDTVCHGDMAWFTANGSGTITWYADPGHALILGTGQTFGMVGTESTIVYVQQSMTGCLGDSMSVVLHVDPRPAPITLEGPSALCPGEPFNLQFNAADSVTYVWTTPMGPQTGGAISIDAVELANAGTYVCVPWYAGCSAAPATHTLVVFIPEEIALPDIMDLCIGGIVSLAVPTGFTNVQWSTGSTAPSIGLTTGADVHVSAVDPNGCAVEAAVLVVVHDCEVIIPNVFSPNGDGINDAWFPTGGFVQANVRIWNRWGGVVFEGDMVRKGWDGRHHNSGNRCSDGVYYFELELVHADGNSRREVGYVHLQ